MDIPRFLKALGLFFGMIALICIGNIPKWGVPALVGLMAFVLCYLIAPRTKGK